jgi:serine/threonine protein kinase
MKKTDSLNDSKSLQEKLQDGEWMATACQGGGRYARVYRMENRDGKLLALKETLPTAMYEEHVLGCTFDAIREIHALNTLHGHPHIVQLEQAHLSYQPLFLPRSLSKKASRTVKDAKQNSEEKDKATKKTTNSKTDANKLSELSPHTYVLLEPGIENAGMWRDHTVQVKKQDAKTGKVLLTSCFHLFLGLRGLHEQKLTHNDLKPENLLRFPKDIFKLSDFGLSSPPEAYSWKSANVFAPGYRAPEILWNKTRAQYSYSADIWAAGVTILFLLCGSVPGKNEKQVKGPRYGFAPFPNGKSSQSMIEDIKSVLGPPRTIWLQQYVRDPVVAPKGVDEEWSGATRSRKLLSRLQTTYGTEYVVQLSSMIGGETFCHVLDLLSKCLQYDPAQRPSAIDCLNHPCFEGVRKQSREAKVMWTPFSRSSQMAQTPSLFVSAVTSRSSPFRTKLRLLRSMIFERVAKILQSQDNKFFSSPEEIASIVQCSISLFDRDAAQFFPASLKVMDQKRMRQIVAFGLACTLLSGKYISMMPISICLSLAQHFSSLCDLSDTLRYECHLINQKGFFFPSSFLTSSFSISADLYSVLNLHLEDQADIAEEMLQVLLKTS